MKLKLGSSAYYVLYRTVADLDFIISSYNDEFHPEIICFWYFQFDQIFSYKFNYRFKTYADVEKLVEDIYNKNAACETAIYDINVEIKNLGIELKK